MGHDIMHFVLFQEVELQLRLLAQPIAFHILDALQCMPLVI